MQKSITNNCCFSLSNLFILNNQQTDRQTQFNVQRMRNLIKNLADFILFSLNAECIWIQITHETRYKIMKYKNMINIIK